MNKFKKLFYLLNPSCSIQMGAVIHGDDYAYCLTAHPPQGKPFLLYSGTHLTEFWKLVTPLLVHTNLHTLPVLLTSEFLEGEDAEHWIDKNEERIIPSGFTSDQVQTEWGVHSDQVFAATIATEQLEKWKKTYTQNRLIHTVLSIPLWDIARLYSRHIPNDFCLIQVTCEGTLLGVVRNGYLLKLCTFWPCVEDYQTEGAELIPELKAILDSISLNNLQRLVLVPGRKNTSVENTLNLLPAQGYEILPAPDIDQVESEFHEPYALSVHEDTGLDFSDMEGRLWGRKIERARKNVLFWSRGSIVVVLLFLSILALVYTGLHIVSMHTAQRLAPIQNEIEAITVSEQKSDSLITLLEAKNAFLGRESVVTMLIENLQTVFPEGMWVEQVDITEKDVSLWNGEIIALCYSTSLIPKLLRNLESIDGVSQVNLLYSEQIRLGNQKWGKKAIRLKTGFVWGK